MNYAVGQTFTLARQSTYRDARGQQVEHTTYRCTITKVTQFGFDYSAELLTVVNPCAGFVASPGGGFTKAGWAFGLKNGSVQL